MKKKKNTNYNYNKQYNVYCVQRRSRAKNVLSTIVTPITVWAPKHFNGHGLGTGFTYS